MKVAMLASTGNACGIAAYTRDLVEALNGLAEVVFEPIEVGKQSEAHYREQADRLNQAEVIHIQHEHSFWGGILPGKSSFWTLRYLLKKPVVITAHTTYSLAELLRLRQEKRPLHRIAKEILLRRSGYRDSVDIAPFVTCRCIVHTEAARQSLIARGANPQYVHAIPAGVPEPAPSGASGSSFRLRYQIHKRRVISLFGYVTPTKGYELVFSILGNLPSDIVLVIAGGPRSEDMLPYEQKLKEIVGHTGLSDRVIFTGYLSDLEIAEVMEVSEVVIAPHTLATGSYSVMIPLTYGLPVVASDLDVFREIQQRGNCIELFRSGDPVDFNDKLKKVLKDTARQEELSRHALAYAQQHSWPEIARRTVEVYTQAILDETRLAHHPTAQ